MEESAELADGPSVCAALSGGEETDNTKHDAVIALVNGS
jgi:hypothetical protein